MVDLSETQRIAAVIPLNFWTDQDQVNGEFVTVDYVEWQKKGNPNHGGSSKIKTLQRHDPAVYEAIRPAYEAWKKGEAEPIRGTPVDNWPSVTNKMAQHLKMNGLRSVEDLAEATDPDMDRLGMGARALREKAKAYISLKSGDAKTAGIVAEQKQQIEALMARVKELEERKTEEPKKRGRPKKEAE